MNYLEALNVVADKCGHCIHSDKCENKRKYGEMIKEETVICLKYDDGTEKPVLPTHKHPMFIG